ncbi:hypothetical protein BH24DEI2_BH24DEI2_00730 [soil metagenome]
MSDQPNPPDADIPEIAAADAEKHLETGAVLVDVREQNEYTEIRIPGSLLMPLSVFAERFGELPKDKPLVMQCRSGARSAKAAEYLLANGYTDVTNLTGGILAWNEAGLPVLRGDEQQK